MIFTAPYHLPNKGAGQEVVVWVIQTSIALLLLNMALLKGVVVAPQEKQQKRKESKKNHCMGKEVGGKVS